LLAALTPAPDLPACGPHGLRRVQAVTECLRSHGGQPRHRANRLLCVAPDRSVLSRLQNAAKVVLAWESIIKDINSEALVIDQLQKRQATNELEAASKVVPQAARECYRCLLCPVQDDPAASKLAVEALALNTSGKSVGEELERVCRGSELVIREWSPIHLRAKLRELYWKDGRTAAGALAFWEDSLRYLYLPRLKDRDVLAAAVRSGATSQDFFGTAYGQDGGKFDGFQFGEGEVSFNDTLLLIEPEAAKRYATEQRKLITALPPEAGKAGGSTTGGGFGATATDPRQAVLEKPGGTAPAKARAFHGTAEVAATMAKMRMVQIAEEVINLLATDPNAAIRVTVEIAADFPYGASDAVRRAVSENAASLGFKTKDWE
jgi:hypothetical protein